MTENFSIAEARRHMARLVDKAEQGQAVRLTRRGKPVAVVISVAQFERLKSGRVPFWPALEAFRDSGELFADIDEVFSSRDPSPGRSMPDL